jgi:hypothetical protein
MPLSVKEDVSPNPIDVRAFGSTTVMFRADDMSYTIEQLGRTTRSYCGPGRVALCPVNTRFAHFMFLIDDDGIVSANASNSSINSKQRCRRSKCRRSTVTVRLETC